MSIDNEHLRELLKGFPLTTLCEEPAPPSFPMPKNRFFSLRYMQKQPPNITANNYRSDWAVKRSSCVTILCHHDTYCNGDER